MVVSNEEIAVKIATEYNRRLNGVAQFPIGTGYLIEKILINKTKNGEWGIFIQSTDGVNVIENIPFKDFIEQSQHPFEYDRFGLSDPMK